MHYNRLWWILVFLIVFRVGGEETPISKSDTSKTSAPKRQVKIDGNKYVGSKSCFDCHEKFNKLWSTYWHGLSVQSYNAEFAKKQLTSQQTEISIGKNKYRAEIGADQGWVLEQGPDGSHRYPILQVIGGKNVCYFLTPLERGRLQVLPVAYDANKREWFDTTASAQPHFGERSDKPLPWTDRQYTFNTSCFNCHVSRLATNYNLETDTYRTSWGEPGISCETCHGPSGEHNRVMEKGIIGRSAQEIKIIINRDLTHDQLSDLCASCHAKIIPLSSDFAPEEKFFDHYDLVTLEHADYYADGRDLGENYSYTSWLMSPCLKSGKLDCKYCHTPAGRFRWTEYQGYQTCMPCHENYVKNPEEHGHHPLGSKGNECVACHMSKTWFAGRARSDHSMRSPSPAATMAFGSPNACNNCHTEHDAAWSDEWVRKWYKRDYQADVLRLGGLIEAARKQQWDRLPEMLAEINKVDIDKNGNNQVYRNSLVRLLRQCNDPRKWEALRTAVKDPSPLVRSSAAAALGERIDKNNFELLLAAAGDESRIVRIRAAMALAAVLPETIKDSADRKTLEKATEELQTALKARADDWSSYANLGNFYMARRDFAEAAKQFENALRLEPRMIEVLINASMAYGNLNENDKAEQCLRRVLETEPANTAANYNLGLLLAEGGKTDEAESALRIAVKSNPRFAPAAYNLAVILAGKNIMKEAIEFCGKAYELRPVEAKYAIALALYLNQQGNADAALAVLKKTLENKDIPEAERKKVDEQLRAME